MVSSEEQTTETIPITDEVFRAQTEIIKRCESTHQLENVRECIIRTVDAGFDAKLAEKLYGKLDARKAELLAITPELAKAK